MTQVVLTEETIARLLHYRFLANSFAYPDLEFARSLFADLAWDKLAANGQALGLETAPIIAQMQEFIQSYGGDVKSLLTDLQIEYTYLFISAVPHVPAPPYESAYTGRGLLMGEPVSQVLQAYREAGLLMNEDFDALPDHIAAEFEFVFYLVQQEAAASEEEIGAWRERQRRFLAQHLVRWGPEFLPKVQSSARKPFYRLLAALAQRWLDSEGERLPMTAQS